MTRQTATSTASDTAWQEDYWYGLTLKEVPTIEPKGTPGYKGQPLKHPRAQLVWVVDGTDDWIHDWVSLTVRNQNDGTVSACRMLICALTQRDPRQEPTPWIDDETLEYGFDAESRLVVSKIGPGDRVAGKGRIHVDGAGYNRLRIEKYGAAAVLQRQVSAAPGPQLSPDGRYMWNGTAWVPYAPLPAPPPAQPPPPPAPAPVPQPAAAPPPTAVQTDLL